VPADHAPQPGQPLLQQRTTLKDAFSQMLEADVSAGVVVDQSGRPVGLITVDQIAGVLRTNGDS
jgi:CBS domain-containing protein